MNNLQQPFTLTSSPQSSMKKNLKKHRDSEINTFCIVVRTAGGLLCRHHRHIHRLFPLLSLISGGLLCLFAFISLLFPPITVTDHHLPSILNSINTRMIVSMNLQKHNAFRVPRDTGGENLADRLWTTNGSGLFYGCSNPTNKFLPTTLPNRYLMIATSGGLNQQRTGITDAIVAAYILNATLVIPILDQKSYWNDASNFSDIFDDDWFISYLAKDVKIVKELPKIVLGGKTITAYHKRVPRKCNVECYLTRVLPILIKWNAVKLTKFDYRLSNHLSTDLQKLRCRVNYHALKFTHDILEMGNKLVKRMRNKSNHFLALHLRFEPDMLAFSGCYYGGGENEREKFGEIRKRWKSLHVNPEGRRQGKCPLTPKEVGVMLRALGYGSDVHIYVASGEIYGGEESLAPLKALFPNIHTKHTIATKNELAPFQSFSSRMAALDFVVCDESDVFVTNNNGNMAKILAGRRRYFGHKPTIRPNTKKLYKDFLSKDNITWEEFASRVRNHQIGYMGAPNETKPGAGVFHENPEACICANFTMGDGVVDDHVSEENDQDLVDREEYAETENAILKNEPELEDM